MVVSWRLMTSMGRPEGLVALVALDALDALEELEGADEADLSGQ